MTQDQKLYFLLGAIYQMAKDAKDEGLFVDLSIEQVMLLYVQDLRADKEVSANE